MKLNKVSSKGNMYGFIEYTGNAIKGKCEFDCSYCYMKRWGNQKPVRLDENEFKAPIQHNGKEVKGSFIFIGSSCDMFAPGIPDEWIEKTFGYCNRFDNTYLYQTKNPARYIDFLSLFPINTIFGTTIESNREYLNISKAPTIFNRMLNMQLMSKLGRRTMVTIEPILDFDVNELVEYIKAINPEWVNIGADSGNNNLPEPPKEKIETLIKLLPDVKIKTNLKRLL